MKFKFPPGAPCLNLETTLDPSSHHQVVPDAAHRGEAGSLRDSSMPSVDVDDKTWTLSSLKGFDACCAFSKCVSYVMSYQYPRSKLKADRFNQNRTTGLTK